MMGRLVGDQDRLFYEFDLDAVVPADHLVRRIYGVLDLSWLHGELAPFYSHTGRASIDPELMMRMLLIGYVFAIRSDEHDATKTMIDRARQRLGLRPRRLPANTAYGAAPILKWLMDRGIEPHIPVWDKGRRAGSSAMSIRKPATTPNR